MELIVCGDYAQLSRTATDMLADQIRRKPQSTLGLATGSTPIGTYEELIDDYQKGKLGFGEVHTYNLDEYVGLPAVHSQSYAFFMRSHLFDHLDIPAVNTHIPNGAAADIDAECRRYTELLNALEDGLDLQLLGMGNNGHIGFNEPGDAFVPDTHFVQLADATIQANARFFDTIDDVPVSAITVGVRPIMRAKKVIVLLYGKGKAAALKAAIQGPVTPRMPASLLQLHPDTVYIADREAASEL